MPNPKLATKLAYLSGLLFAASFALMVAQIIGDMPVGLAMYAALGAVVSTMGYLAMWTVNKVHAMHVEQTTMLAERFAEAPTGEIKTTAPKIRSTPVAVVVSTPRLFESDIETVQRRPTLSSIPAALLGQLVRLGYESQKNRRDGP